MADDEAEVEEDVTVDDVETTVAPAKAPAKAPVADAGIQEWLSDDWVYVSSLRYVGTTVTTPVTDADGNVDPDKVNTFDTMTQTLTYATQMVEGAQADGAGVEGVQSGYMHFKFTLPCSAKEATWATASMGWMGTKYDSLADVEEAVAEGGIAQSQGTSCYVAYTDGDGNQVLEGYRYMSPSESSPVAFPGSGELTASIHLLAPANGTRIDPTYQLWMDHDETVQTVKAEPGPEVTGTLHLNTKLAQTDAQYRYYEGTYDFSTGNDNALDKDAGTVYGLGASFGIGVAMYNPVDNGMIGCAVPSGDISVDLNFQVTYISKDGQTIDLSALGYTPLIWSYDKTQDVNPSETDGRQRPNSIIYSVRNSLPTDTKNSSSDAAWTTRSGSENTVWSGGGWIAAKAGKSTTFTVSDYTVNPNWFPRTWPGNGNPIGGTDSDNSKTRNGFFASSRIIAVYPYTFTDIEGNEIDLVEEYGAGSLSVRATESNLRINGEEVKQEVASDDSWTFSREIGVPGYYKPYIKYRYSAGDTSHNTDYISITNGGYNTASIGQTIGIRWGLQAYPEGSEANMITGLQSLVKLDASAIEVTGSFGSNAKLTGLYGAIKSHPQSNWESESEMNAAREEDFIWFSSRSELEAAGYVCTAMLQEWREPTSTAVGSLHNYYAGVSAKVRDDVGAYERLTDNVYQIRVVNTYWTRRSGVEPGDIPSRLEVQDGKAEMPANSSVLVSNNYQKSQYTNGVLTKTHNDGDAGDSVYILPYKASITKGLMQVEQTASGTRTYNTYDLDTGKRVADYSIKVSLTSPTGDQAVAPMTTTVTITDTLPDGLTYIPGSSYYGGTYQQTALGKRGTVTGGEQLEPTTVVKNADGTTTIIWNIENAPAGIGELSPLYYSCEIGEAGSQNDVTNGQVLRNTARVDTTEDRRDPTYGTNIINGKQSTASISVVKTNMAALAKYADSRMIETDGNPGWTLVAGNNSQKDIDNTVLVDVLPANDVAGSSFVKGAAFAVDDLSISGVDNVSDWHVFYTTSEAVRDLSANDFAFDGSTVSAKASGDNAEAAATVEWSEAEVGDDGSLSIPGEPTALAFGGTIKASQTFRAHMVLDPTLDLDPLDRLVNQFSQGENTVSSTVYVVQRTIEGVVWFDKDADGQRAHAEDNAELLVPGVLVQLTKLNEETGKYEDVAGTTTKTDANGAYRFEGLKSGTYGVRFEKGDYASFSFLDGTTANTGSDLYDSDATPTSEGGKLQSAAIEGLSLPTIAQMGSNTFTSSYNDLGLIEPTIPVSVTKVWSDADDQDGIRPDDVTVQVKANGTKVREDILSEDNGWATTFEGLPVYPNKAVEGQLPQYDANASAIAYTVNEITTSVVTGRDAAGTYALAVTGDVDDGFVVTNTHTPEVADVTVTKTWEDDSNRDGKRPESVALQLYKAVGDAEPEALEGKTATLSSAGTAGTTGNSWTYTFEDLPVYEGGKKITYTVDETAVPEGYEKSASGLTVTNTYEPERTFINGSKTWSDSDNAFGLRPVEIVINLLKNGADAGVKKTVKAGDDWSWMFDNLFRYEGGREVTYTVREDAVTGYDTSYDGDHLNVTNTLQTVDVTLTKTWSDADNLAGDRPTADAFKAALHLLAGDADVTSTYASLLSVVDNENGTYTATWTGLPKVSAAGPDVAYTVTEDAIENYTSSSITGSKGTFQVTNTRDTGSLTVSKTVSSAIAADKQQDFSFTVTLGNESISGEFGGMSFTDGVATFALKDGESKTATGLPTGTSYSVAETANVEFTTEPASTATGTIGAGVAAVAFTNTRKTIDIKVTKSWSDANDQDGIRPDSVTVNLLAGDETVRTAKVTKDDGWEYTFTGVPEYANGKKITYAVTEDAVEGYEGQIDGFTITNTHTPETVDISGVKSWDDANDQDGIRPDSVTVNLLADGKVIDSAEVTADDEWKYEFIGLPKFAAGEEIEYTVSEEAVEGYEATIDGFDIANKHVPETTSVTVTKSWSDANNQDGIRPESVTVNLLADGKKVDSTTVTADDKWSHEFTGLPKFADGEEIEYTVTEDAVEGYDSSVSGYTITNTHTPATVDVSGTKTWADADYLDQPGYERPESVTVRLIGEVTGADGTKDTVYSSADLTVTADDDWAYAWTDLAAYNAGRKISYRVVEVTIPDGYAATYDGASVTNTPVVREEQIDPVTLDINKTDSVTDHALAGAIFTLTNADGDVVQTVTTDASGAATITFTAAGAYRLTETAPTGYTSDPGTWMIEVTKSGVDNVSYDDPTEGVWTWAYHLELGGDYASGTLSVPNDPTLVDIEVNKTWADASDQDGIRPASVAFQLYKAVGDADPVAVEGKTVTLNGTGDTWTATYEDLPAYEDGKPVTYTVDEVAVPEGYTKAVSADGLTLTNTHEPATVDVSGTKTWSDADNQDGIRPESVTVNLLADGTKVDSAKVTKADGWKYSFTNLPKYAAGKEIAYTVSEDAVEGYEATIDGFAITNTHVPATVDVSGTKTWADAGDQDGIRPASVTVNLLADGTKVDSAKVTGADGWKYAFTNLPKFAAGKEIAYTVSEDVVEGYEATIDGFAITNTHVPEITEATVRKVWDDANNQDGKRPASLIVTLSDGQTVTLSEANNWEATVKGLPRYEAGKEITYTWSEPEVAGYTLTDASTSGTITTLTNTHEAETTTVSGTKTWADNDDRDGLRPSSVTLRLYADGSHAQDVVVTPAEGEADAWAWRVEGLPRYAEGKVGQEIRYTVSEVVPEGYVAAISGLDVTNTHEAAKTSVTVTKEWDDAGDQDGIRPESVSVQLTADGAPVGEAVTLSADNAWAHTWPDLYANASGVGITYAVEEVAVPEGYEASVAMAGSAAEGFSFTLTNTHTPATVDISGTKTWDDADDQDGIRPESVTVNLLADGTKIDSAEVTGADGWKYAFADLPKFAAGKEVEYTVSEDTVEGYTATVSGFNITNKHVPETTSVIVSKAWADADDQDGIRPASITVNLLADGTKVDNAKVTEADGWEYAFTDLPKFAAGTEVKYTVTEDAVEGYTATIDGFNITNKHVPETTSVTVTKTWDDADDQDGIRPTSVTVNLLADGTKVDSAKVTEADGWKYSFTSLPKFAAGKEIKYTVSEDAVEGYTATIDGFDIANTHEPERVELTGSKTWNDNGDKEGLRPDSVTIHLLADGVEIASKTVTADDGWAWSFGLHDRYSGGKEVVYTITEDAVAYYEAPAYAGLSVTNTRNAETVEVSIRKDWNDVDDQDGIRPEAVTVRLVGTVVTGSGTREVFSGTASLTAESDWAHSFTGLAKYAEGLLVAYTVREVDVPEGYTSEVTGTAVDGFAITNTHVPTTIDISGTKSWDDAGDQDGIRPASITVNLLADGKKVDSATVTEADGWKYSFTSLPKFAAGKEIAYTVIEDTVEGYTATVSGFNITNKHVPATVDVSGTKTWADADYQGIDGYTRPTSVRVQVIGEVKAEDGSVSTAYTGSVLTVTEADDWAYAWKGLPARSAGQDISYRVVELDVPAGFGATYSGTNVTNTPDERGESIDPVTLDIAKTDAATGNALAGATFTVTNADGAQLAAAVTDASGKATLTFDAVGTYTITETAPTGYLSDPGTWTVVVERSGVDRVSYNDPAENVWTWLYHLVFGEDTSFDGTTLSVANEPVRADVTATKVWADASDQDGARPDSVIFQLYKTVGDADPVAVEGETATLSGTGDTWTAAFEGLPAYEDGEPVTYTVDEVAVPEGYAKVVSADGLTVTNTHVPTPTNEPVPPSGPTRTVPAPVDTGDDTQMLPSLAAMAVSGVVLLALALDRARNAGRKDDV